MPKFPPTGHSASPAAQKTYILIKVYQVRSKPWLRTPTCPRLPSAGRLSLHYLGRLASWGYG